MTKRKAVRVQATPDAARRIRDAIREEAQHADATKVQAREAFQQLSAQRSAVDRLRDERERQGLSLADIAARTGMTRASISRLENHHTNNPTVQTLWRYASALGMRLDLRVSRAE